MKTDRDLLAQWAGEELTAHASGMAAARELHAARGRFYLDMLRGAMRPAAEPPRGRS